MKATAPMHADDPKLHFYLVSAVVNFDKRAARGKAYNVWALPQYLEAITRLEADLANMHGLRWAVLNNFNGRLADAILRTIGHPLMSREEARYGARAVALPR